MRSSYPADADGDALRDVLEGGSDMTEPMMIDYSIGVPDEASARLLAAAVEGAGFDPSISENSAGGPWSVHCSKSMLATYEGVVATQTQLNAIAKPFGGRCAGWGSFGNS